MRRLTILLFFAILTFVIILYIRRPDLVSHVWLWVVGLAAPVIGLIRRFVEYLKSWVNDKILNKPAKPASNQAAPKN